MLAIFPMLAGGLGGLAYLLWVWLALTWLAAILAALRRWGRKALVWTALSVPLTVALATLASWGLLFWLCTRPPGCLSAGF